MKKLVILFLVFSLGLVSSSVVVNNHSVEKSYYPFNVVRGFVDLEISGEDFFSVVSSNDGDEMLLSDFLILNGADYDCSPPDCSNDYSVLGSSGDEIFSVGSNESIYSGFVLDGEDVVVTDISFDIESDFGVGSNNPLFVNFFERENWRFGEFSSDYYSESNWGCYDIDAVEVGPLIRKSVYCEMIGISDTGSLFVGAYVDNGDNVDLKMSVYSESGGAVLGSCVFNPGSEEGCRVDAGAGGIFSKGNYQVCVSSVSSSVVTDYSLYQDSVGENCGFVYSVGPWDSREDYAIFAREAKFADASYLGRDDFDFDEMVDAANDLILERYDGDCSDGCVLPIVLSGVPQNLRISNVAVSYSNRGRESVVRDVGELEMIPATVDFSGVLDLEVLGFDVSESKKYSISIDDDILFNEKFEVLPAPIVVSVSPLNPPAGVPIEFFVLVDFGINDSLSYSWDFGDGDLETTNAPRVEHVYSDLGNYSLKIKVSAGNLSSEKIFEIKTISPEDAVGVSLRLKNESLIDFSASLSALSLWYESALRDLIGLDFFSGEIDRLAKESENASNGEFVEIAKELYGLNIPTNLVLGDSGGRSFFTDLEDVNPEVVADVSGENVARPDDYKKSILNWQIQNVNVGFSVEDVSVSWWNGDGDVVLKAYSFDVVSTEDSYFVINAPKDDLVFRESVGTIDVDPIRDGSNGAGGSTVVELDAGVKESFEFYSVGDVSFFVSPKLSTIVIEEDIDESCNYNLVCEKGEDYESCRSDCKPIGLAIFYSVVGLVVLLFFYTLLVFWYKINYEGHLFGDRAQLYNLLMFIANAKARGFDYSRIAADLRRQGWSSERVRYAIRKARGKRTGMIEIVPVTLIGSWILRRRARKTQGRFAVR